MPPKKGKSGQQRPSHEGDQSKGRKSSYRGGQHSQENRNSEKRDYQGSSFSPPLVSQSQSFVPSAIPNAWNRQKGSGPPLASQSQTSVPPTVPNAWNRQQASGPSLIVPPQDVVPSAQLPKPNVWNKQQTPGASSPQLSTIPTDAGKGESSSLLSKDVSGAIEPITTALGELNIKEQRAMIAQIPKRKNPGVAGQQIHVLVNMLPILYGKNFPKVCFKYDVAIRPEKPKYLLDEVYKVVKLDKFAKYSPAFDGRRFLYSARKLPINDELTMKVTVKNADDKEMEFQVTIKKIEDLNFVQLQTFGAGVAPTPEIAECLQALNTILQQPAYTKKFLRVGRSFFTINSNPTYLTGGMDLQRGLFQSALMTWKPLLNVDVAHKGFPTPQSVIDLIRDITNNDNPSFDDIKKCRDKIDDYLRGLRVTYEFVNSSNERTKRSRQIAHALIMKPPSENFFEGPEKKIISVQFYFEECKQYKIKYPHYPCLHIGNKNKNCYVPIELCRIEAGQTTRKKLNENQTRRMVQNSTAGTEIRQKNIKQLVKQVGYSQNPCLKEFDINIGDNFEQIPARILDPPDLTYKDNLKVTPSKGVWFSDKFLISSGKLERSKSWTIFNLANVKDEVVWNFSTQFIKTAKTKNITVGEPLTPFKSARPEKVNPKLLEDYFGDVKRNQVKFVIVIFSDRSANHYQTIKQVAELKVGILTQCIKSFTVEKKLNPATLINILQKVNAKLDGTNHILHKDTSRPECLQRPCMIVGADVTHPSPDSKDIPSIAAVAASHDCNAFRYNVKARFQVPKQEIIVDLKNIMVEQLKFFQQKTNYVPERIIYYRDGVSDGQFSEILTRELIAIRAACTSLNEAYKPKITFIVVQKRHHKRFFPINELHSDDARKNFNVKAGTVVDTIVTHPTDIDFYLVSHASIQAHLAAFRARHLIQGVPIDLNNLAQEQKKFLNIREEILKDQPMFFV